MIRTSISKILLTVAMPFMLTCVQAQVFKCTDGTGKVGFSDHPCATAQQSSQVKLAATPPASVAAPPSIKQPTGAMSPGAAAYEQRRQEKRAQSNAAHERIDTAAARVHQIRHDNADPAKCEQVRSAMALMQRQEPITYNLDVSYFDYQQKASLYCGN